MASFTLNWTPAGGFNSLNQDVQYKRSDSSTWITYQNVSPTVNTLQITGLEDNIKYDFRIVDNCEYGGPVASQVFTAASISCVALNWTSAYNKIEFSFNHPGGNIDSYVVNLLDMGNTLIASKTITTMTPVISGAFTGLPPSTNYQLQVIISVGGSSRTCPVFDVATSEPPVCEAPTNVSVTLSL